MLERHPTHHQTLLDVVGRKLYFEIARESLNDFVQPKIDRLQSSQLGSGSDPLIEPLKFLVRIGVFPVHPDYRTPFGGIRYVPNRIGPVGCAA